MKEFLIIILMLAALGVSAVLAGCSSSKPSDPSGETAAPTAEATVIPTETPEPTETPSADETEAPDDLDEPVTFVSAQFENAIRNKLRIYMDQPVLKRDVLRVKELDLQSLKLSDIRDIAMFENLNELWIPGSGIEDISPLAGLTKLKKLGLGYNNIRDISPLAGLTGLWELTLAGNPVEDLSPLSEMKRLTKLDLGDYINPDRTPMTRDISPIGGLTSLVELNVITDDLTPISGMTRLSRLCITGSFDNLGALTDLKELKELRITCEYGSLDLSGLAACSALRMLSIQCCETEDISPLAGLTGLTMLSLNMMPVSDISPLANLTNISDLFISCTNVRDLTPLYGLNKLVELGLTFNNIPESEVQKLREHNPSCYINHEEH